MKRFYSVQLWTVAWMFCSVGLLKPLCLTRWRIAVFLYVERVCRNSCRGDRTIIWCFCCQGMWRMHTPCKGRKRLTWTSVNICESRLVGRDHSHSDCCSCLRAFSPKCWFVHPCLLFVSQPVLVLLWFRVLVSSLCKLQVSLWKKILDCVCVFRSFAVRTACEGLFCLS